MPDSELTSSDDDTFQESTGDRWGLLPVKVLALLCV